MNPNIVELLKDSRLALIRMASEAHKKGNYVRSAEIEKLIGRIDYYVEEGEKDLESMAEETLKMAKEAK